MEVPDKVPQPKDVQQVIDERVVPQLRWLCHGATVVQDASRDFVLPVGVDWRHLRLAEHGMAVTEEQRSAILVVQADLEGLTHGGGMSTGQLDEEQEQEQEQEKEQEVEIEKFVELAYSREDEAPDPWKFEDLRLSGGPSAFYSANLFKLYGRQPLLFPTRVHASGEREGDLLLSSNYFNLKWSGDRRLRNLCLMLDWSPRATEVSVCLVCACAYPPFTIPPEFAAPSCVTSFAAVSSVR